LILAEELSYTTPIKQPTSTKTHSYTVISLSTLYIYYTQTYYKITGRHTGTPLNYLEGNSNWQFIADHNHLLRPSQLKDGINKDNNIFYPFASFAEWI
jgi:hypothetical protein